MPAIDSRSRSGGDHVFQDIRSDQAVLPPKGQEENEFLQDAEDKDGGRQKEESGRYPEHGRLPEEGLNFQRNRGTFKVPDAVAVGRLDMKTIRSRFEVRIG